MPSLLESSRLLAFRRQDGLCFYCRLPVWLDDSAEFQQRYPMSAAQHALRRCTAEHLTARQDGGSDEPENIAAACWICNVRRHRGGPASSPAQHRLHVQRRLRRGAWLPQATLHAFALVARRAQA